MIALLIYQLGFPLVVFFVILTMLVRGRGRVLREGGTELKERLGRPVMPSGGGPIIWVHAASVGEVAASSPLIERLKARGRVVMTTSTAAGRERARKIEGVEAAFLAPADFFPCVLSFLKRVRPTVLILIETEIWPMTLVLAAWKGVRVAMANGRVRKKTAGRYRLAGWLFRRVFSSFDVLAVQSKGDAERFAMIGARPGRIEVTGNMKYDVAAPTDEDSAKAREKVQGLGWGGSPVWIAASTWRGEEEILLEAHAAAKERVAGLRLILAPRHPERAGEVEKLLREKGVRFVRHSQLLPFDDSPECLLIDVMGVLPTLYPLAGLAFVGGSLVEVGGHNLLEPALCRVPVAFGPHVDTVKDVASELEAQGGGRTVRDPEDLASTLEQWVGISSQGAKAGGSARGAAESFTGGTGRTFQALEKALPKP